MPTHNAVTGLEGPLAGFVKVSDGVYALEPRSNKQPESRTSPALIVLFAWLDGSPRHLRMYITHYSLRHPTSRIIAVFTTKVHVFLTSQQAQQRRLEPLLAYASQVGQTSWSGLGNSATSGILIHAFSNGGLMQFTHLARMHAASQSKPLAPAAVFYDSCPGIATYQRTVAALTHSLPRNPVLAFLLRMILFILISAVFGFGILFRKVGLRRNNNMVLQMRADLINHNVLSSDAALAYLYSREDKMIAAEDVETHAAEAKASGYDVVLKRFEGSKHVAHAFASPEEYWKFVEGRWDEAIKSYDTR